MAKKRISPTALTLKRLRKSGYLACVVERWNAHSRIRQDMFGFVDIVAVHASHKQMLFVQATSYTNILSRVKKIIGECSAESLTCMDAGVCVEVWGWKKKGQFWEPTVRPIERAEIISGLAKLSRASKRKAKKQVDQKSLEF